MSYTSTLCTNGRHNECVSTEACTCDCHTLSGALLERIATALEEQNRFNWQWLEQNRAWHEENTEYPSRMLAIHEEHAARDKAHRERLERMAEEQVTFTNETIQKSYEAFLSSLKEPSKEVLHAVEEALASDMRKSTGAREP